MGLTNNKPSGLEWLALQIRAARQHRVHITMDDLLHAIDMRSGEKMEAVFNYALDRARSRQEIEGRM
jgi:hypothetical protein